MARRLSYADKALADLDDVKLWQTEPGSGLAAIRRLKRIRAAIRRLKINPCLYAPEGRRGVREMACDGHRVIYIVILDTGNNATAGDVTVLRVFGAGQERP